MAKQSTRPRQIANDLEARIKRNEFDVRIPTYLEIRDTYAASSKTVWEAVSILVARELVTTIPGQGVYVKKGSN